MGLLDHLSARWQLYRSALREFRAFSGHGLITGLPMAVIFLGSPPTITIGTAIAAAPAPIAISVRGSFIQPPNPDCTEKSVSAYAPDSSAVALNLPLPAFDPAVTTVVAYP